MQQATFEPFCCHMVSLFLLTLYSGTFAAPTCEFQRYADSKDLDPTQPALIASSETALALQRSVQIMRFVLCLTVALVAFISWLPGVFANAHGAQPVQVAHPAYLVAAQGMVEEVTTVGEYLDDLQWATEDNGTVVFDGVSGGALLEERAALFKNIKDDMKHVFKDARMILSMAPEGQGLGFHLHAATWLKLWHGHKEWLVYPPGKMPAALHSSANVHGRFEHELIESLPKEQQPLRCIQQPGDIVYLPGAPRLFY